MSQKHVEAVVAMWETWMAGDPADLDLSLLAPDVIYDDDLLPDHGNETYHGHDGIQRAWDRAIEPWEDDSENLVEWTRDAGDEVVSCHRVRGRGRASQIEVDFRYAYRWRFEGDKVVYLKSYRDPAAALEAAGMSE